MSEPDFHCVIMTSGDRGTPHLAALQASNPALTIGSLVAPETGEDGWRNCDRNIRTWWRENGAAVTTRRVLFLEYDVLVNCDLTEAFPPTDHPPGIEGVSVQQQVRDGRSWLPFRELDRLPESMRSKACGLAPLAVVMLSRNALEDLCDPRLDEVFAADIFSELRLGSVVRHLGYLAAANPRLAQVDCKPIANPGNAPGIWHAVKGGAA